MALTDLLLKGRRSELLARRLVVIFKVQLLQHMPSSCGQVGRAMADGSGQNKVLLAQKLHHYMNDLIALLIAGHSSADGSLRPVPFRGPMGANRADVTAGNLP